MIWLGPLWVAVSGALAFTVMPVDRSNCAISLDRNKGETHWRSGLEDQVRAWLKENRTTHLALILKTLGPEGVDLDHFGIEALIPKERSLFREELARAVLKDLESAPRISRLVAVATEKECAVGVDFELRPREGMITSTYDGDEAAPDARRNVEAAVPDEERFQPTAVGVCTAPFPMKSPLVKVDRSIRFDLPKEVFFKDNQHELLPEQVKILKSAFLGRFQSIKESLVGRSRCTLRMESGQILTSSSRLANAVRIGKYDFRQLSERRAKTLLRWVRSWIGEPVRGWVLDFKGEHGDGSSGECPYEVSSKAPGYQLRPGLELDRVRASQFGRVVVEFEQECPSGQPLDPAPRLFENYQASKCFELRSVCKK